jgi:hypothetical protein
VVGTVTPVIQPVVDTVTPVIEPVVGTVTPVIQPVVDTVTPVIEPVVGPVARVVKPETETIAPAAQPVVETVGPVAQPVSSVVEPMEPVVEPVELVASAEEPIQIAQPIVPTTLEPQAETVVPVSGPAESGVEPAQQITGPKVEPLAPSINPVADEPKHESPEPAMVLSSLNGALVATTDSIQETWSELSATGAILKSSLASASRTSRDSRPAVAVDQSVESDQDDSSASSDSGILVTLFAAVTAHAPSVPATGGMTAILGAWTIILLMSGISIRTKPQVCAFRSLSFLPLHPPA